MSVYIALGANLSSKDEAGNAVPPAQTFDSAARALKARGVNTAEVSALWQSPAWPPGSDQPDYINACARISTRLDAREALLALHDVEREFGRERGVKNAARPLDLDLLDYKGQVIAGSDIQIPHPRMLSRGFVLFPLSEVAPHWADPVHGIDIWDWIARLPLADVTHMRRLS